MEILGELKDMGSRDNKIIKRDIQHPLFGISPRNWIRILSSNGGIDGGYIHRAIFITVCSLFTIPVRLFCQWRYGSKISKQKIEHPPVFIIGHWRSGTTYLHELLSQDPQFCYISLWNTLLPNSFLILEPLKRFLSRFLPSERPMDKIKVDIDGPYEEEAGIAVLSPWSFFHCLHFPRNAEEQYLKSIHFQGLSSEEKEKWKTDYLTFMKTVTHANKGKRLLLKNPANTGRINTLLELFPGACFIHIYRNPYTIYLSTIKMRNRVLDKLALQEANTGEIEAQVINNYTRIMDSYFEQKKQIPDNNFAELRYEDLVSDPLGQVQKIYKKLGLPGIKCALPQMKKYLDTKKDYKTNVYSIDELIIQKIKKKWGFTINLWNYEPPK